MSTPTQPPTPPTELRVQPPVQSIQDILSQACAGLTFPSETDAPFKPFAWPEAGAEVTAQSVARAAKLPAAAHIEQQSLEEFFAPAVAEEDWMNAQERAAAKGLQSLLQTLKANLRDATVFKVGEGTIEAFIIGRAAKGLAGLQTTVAES